MYEIVNDMKTIIGLILMGMLGTPLLQAGRASTYPDALRKAGDNGAVLFCYGVGWDELSDKAYQDYIKSHKIDRAARAAVVLPIPLYDNPTADEKKNFDRVMGGKSLPGGIRTVPSMVIVDENGNFRASVEGSDVMGEPEKALDELAQKLKNIREQNKLLGLSERAKGERKLRLLSDAFDLGPTIPDKYLKDLPPDPKHDKNGYSAKLRFDPIALVASLQGKSLQDAEAQVRGMMELKSFTPKQRQLMYAALAGHFRRSGGTSAQLKQLYEEMHAVDPDSMYGAYAKEAMRLWCGGLGTTSGGKNSIEPGSGDTDD